MYKGCCKPWCMCLFAIQHPERGAVQGPVFGFRYKMIKFVRSDDQSDSCLGIILLQAVFHGAGAKCFTGDAGILKTAFKQLGNLMEKGIALLCCPEVNFIPLSKQGAQGVACFQCSACLAIPPWGSIEVCSLAWCAGHTLRPHSVKRLNGAVSFHEREFSKRWSSSLSRCSCNRRACKMCSSFGRFVLSGGVMMILPV